MKCSRIVYIYIYKQNIILKTQSKILKYASPFVRFGLCQVQIRRASTMKAAVGLE